MHSSLFIIAAFVISLAIAPASMFRVTQGFASTEQLVSGKQEDPRGSSMSENRIAVRLQARIRSRFGFAPAIQGLVSDMRVQRDLLSRNVVVTFVPDDGAAIAPWATGSDRFMRVDVTLGGIRSVIDIGRISSELREHLPEGIRLPVGTTLLGRTAVDGIARMETEGIAKSGYDFDPDSVAQRVAEAFRKNELGAEIAMKTLPGTVSNATDEDLGELELLASGRSNFEGSGKGRKNNIRKGLSKYMHNLIVEPNEEFSINRVLKEVPIREWEMALGIFSGGELRMVPGGGICQVATTLYRGILNAGFPVTKRSNHSLFVHYYEKYGVGIDATIFPASAPDLRFVNDTQKPLLIQAYFEGDEATVNIYGTPDNRNVRVTGPYFAENAPEDFRVDGKKLSSREIAWVRDVTYEDGSTDQYVVLSRYKSIPRSVVKEYAQTLSSKPANMHAAVADLNAHMHVQ